MEQDLGRRILWNALSLHLLLTEDIRAAKTGADDPLALLAALEHERLLRSDLVGALEKLSLAQLGGVQVASSPREAFGSFLRSLEWDPSLLDPPASSTDTLLPQRGPGSDILLPPSCPEGSTIAPQREESADFELPHEGVAATDTGTAGGGTVAGEVAATDTGTAGGGTVAGGEELLDDDETLQASGGAAAGEELGFDSEEELTTGDDGPDRSLFEAASPLEEGSTLVPELSVGERFIDLDMVSSKLRRQLEEAAFLRAVVKDGHLDPAGARRALEASRERRTRLEEHLVQSEILDRKTGRAIRARIATPRLVCQACLVVAPAGAGWQDPCSVCAHVPVPAFSARSPGWAGISTSGDDTISSETVKALPDTPIGVPGEGGQFAGHELLTRIAEGGMGVVFKARERTLNRIVALKVMRGGGLASENRRRRFLTEAEAAAALNHPNIVPIHQISESSGYPFYTMDYIEGQTIGAFVRKHACSPVHVAGLMLKLADAVHHFHLRGIIHRDLKPENILVDEAGEPFVIDFGIAKKISTDFETSASWTVEGEVLGTPHYMPPEQARGNINEIDTRSDVYALGGILYELLSGKRPFHGLPAARVVVAIQEQDPAPLEVEDRDLKAIVGKAMAKERERRYQSALELSQDLFRFLNYQPILARPASITYRTRKLLRRHRGLVSSLAFAAAVLIGLGVIAIYKFNEDARRVRSLSKAAAVAPRADRQALLAEALAIDEGNALVRAQLEQAKQEIKAEEELRLAEERRLRELAEQALAQERERMRLRDLEEKERARDEAQRQARLKAERRARSLLARSKQAQDPLEAIGGLTDALVLVTEGQGELGAEIARRKISLSLELADRALVANEPGLAGFWLREARKLEAAKADENALALQGVEDRIRSLTSGQSLHSEAKQSIREGNWLLARDKLRQARKRGVAEDILREEEGLVAERCSQKGQQLLGEGRARLAEGQPELGMAKARSARDYLYRDEQPAALELIEQCAQVVGNRVRLEASKLFNRSERQHESLTVLTAAARALQGTAVARSLEEERSHRADLLLRPDADSLVYVNAQVDVGLAPFYIRRTEVTNQEYLAFVQGGGYTDRSLYTKLGLQLLPTFRDATPGEARFPGPRTWRKGTFGDQANASRPVRGVTYHEARAYARWLSRRTGHRWRLPTVEEWEIAAGWDPETRRLRAYPWGEQFDAGGLAKSLALPRPSGWTPTDRSALGLLDTGGSLSEWVRTKKGLPALKGTSFAASSEVARHQARVRTTGSPGASPPRELVVSIGFRLVLETSHRSK